MSGDSIIGTLNNDSFPGSNGDDCKRKKFAPDILQRVRKLNKPDNWSNLFYIFVDYGIIALAIILVNLKPFLSTYLLSLLIIGSRMRALENLTHEASHHSLFRHPFFNQWFGVLFCSFPIGTSLYTYRQSHLQHHKYLGELDKDPDYIRYHELGIDLFPIPRLKLIYHLLKVFCLFHVPRYLYGTLRFFVYSVDEPAYEKASRFLFWAIIFVALTIFNGWSNFFFFWIIPFMTSFQVLRYLAEMSEHGGLYGSEREINLTRNNLCNPILRFFQYPHGDYYHLVHHFFPTIPHYNLGRVHRILLEDEEYLRGHHCYGYFLPSRPERNSTLEEMML